MVHVAVRCHVLNVRIQVHLLTSLAEIISNAVTCDRSLRHFGSLQLRLASAWKWDLAVVAAMALYRHHVLQYLVNFAALISFLFQVVVEDLGLQAVDLVLGWWPRRLQPWSA